MCGVVITSMAGVGVGVRGESFETKFAGGGEDASSDFASCEGFVSDDEGNMVCEGQGSLGFGSFSLVVLLFLDDVVFLLLSCIASLKRSS